MREPTILRFISIAYRNSQIFINRELKERGIDLGAGQYPFVLFICRNPGFNQDAVSDGLSIDKGTTAKALKELVAKGYIERCTDERDKRNYRVYATERGRALKAELDLLLGEWRERLLTGLDPQERESAYSLVERIASNAREASRGC